MKERNPLYVLVGLLAAVTLSGMSCEFAARYHTSHYPPEYPYYCVADIYRDLPGNNSFHEKYTTYLWPHEDLDGDGDVDIQDALVLCNEKIDGYITEYMAPGFVWKKQSVNVSVASPGMDGADCTDTEPVSPTYGGPWGSLLSWEDPDGDGPAEIPSELAYAWVYLKDPDGNEYTAEPYVKSAVIALAEHTGLRDSMGVYDPDNRHVRVSHMELDLKEFNLGDLLVTKYHVHNINTVITDGYGALAKIEPFTVKLWVDIRGQKDGGVDSNQECVLNDLGTGLGYALSPDLQYFLLVMDNKIYIGDALFHIKLKLASPYGTPFQMHQPFITLPQDWVRTSPVALEPYAVRDGDNNLMRLLWFENFETPDEVFLGEGNPLPATPFSTGEHKITVVVYDSQGAHNTRTAILTVPPPDDCANAIPIGDGQYRGTLAVATNDGDASCGSTYDQPDVWYSYRARAPGILSVNTCGTNDLGGEDMGIDTVLSVHTDCGDPIESELSGGCNDDWANDPLFGCLGIDGGQTRDSSVSVRVGASQEVLIRVSKLADSVAGKFLLNVALSVESCPGDFNGDGDVDTFDLEVLAGEFGQSGDQVEYESDFNDDDDVDGQDLAALIQDYGRTNCP